MAFETIIYEKIDKVARVTMNRPEVRNAESRQMNREMFEGIVAKGNKTTDLVNDLCRVLVERFNGFSLHDPQAMTYVIDPSMFTTEKYKADVECSGELTRGMTVVERRFYRIVKDEANVDVVVKVEADRFLKLINERISGE